MAGRPRKQAEAVTGLEGEAMNLSMGVFLEMPKQYRERPNYDPICQAWNDALDATALATTAMDKLGGLLRSKAKITEPGPYEEMLLEDDAPHKPISPEWKLLSACMEKVKQRAQLAYDLDPAGCQRLVEAHVGG